MMNDQEKIVQAFLYSQGYSDIDFEPLGESKPPDFSLNRVIGVEVRKLNKQIILGQKMIDIEELKHQMYQKLNNFFSQCEMSTHPHSYYVDVNYRRPLKLKSDFLKKLKDSLLEAVMFENLDEYFFLTKNFKYRLIRTQKMEKTFEIVGWKDLDDGGCVQEDRYLAIKKAIAEKNEKLNSIKNQFSELWLILVDTIFSRVDITTKQDFDRFPKIQSIFDRVILISSRNPNDWIDLN